MKKRILIITSETNFSFANPNSAVVKYLETLAVNLRESGHEVDTFPHEGQSENSAFVENKTRPRSQIKKLFRYFFPRVYASLILKKKILTLNSVPNQIIKKYLKPDLILEFLSAGSEIGARLKVNLKVPLVVIYDSPLREQFCEMHKVTPFNVAKIDQIEKLVLKEADIIISYAQCVKEYISQKFNPKAEIYLMPCITWKQEIGFNPDKQPLIGFIGSFLSWHRVDLLVEAFIEISSEFPDARLILLGYGQEWERINEKVLSSGVHLRVEMPGFVTEQQLWAYKQSLLIGVMPGSNWYGSPLKLFEYAQSSIAIIAPETPAVIDLFTQDEVLFINRNNSYESLVQNLRLLLKDTILRNRLIEKASAKMNGEFSQEEQMKLFNQIIANTLKNGIEE